MAIVLHETGFTAPEDSCPPVTETNVTLAEPDSEAFVFPDPRSASAELEVPGVTVLGESETSSDSRRHSGEPYAPRHAKPHESLPRRISQRWDVIKTAGQAAVAASLLTPLNEAIRGAAVIAGFTYSHSPEFTATTFGASTLAVELVGGLAAASVMDTDVSQRFTTRLHHKMPETLKTDGLSPATEAVIAFSTGTVVGMGVKQIQDPERTKQDNQRYAVRTSVGLGVALAGVGAVVGAEGPSALNVVAENPTISASTAGGVVALEAGRRLIRRFRFPKKVENIETETWQDSDKFASYHLVTDPDQLEQARTTEQAVWDEMKYGKLDEEGYDVHIAASRTFGAFDEAGECVGVTRVFGANKDEEVVPPFLEMEFYDEDKRQSLRERAYAGVVEELGTTAVIKPLRHKGVNAHMWRQAYRDVEARGIVRAERSYCKWNQINPSFPPKR